MFQGKKVKYILYFGVIVAIGSGGFYTIGGNEWSIIDSIYMTIITLSTVVFGEVYPLGGTGEWAPQLQVNCIKKRFHSSLL